MLPGVFTALLAVLWHCLACHNSQTHQCEEEFVHCCPKVENARF
jgi:hypothetical protein